MAQRTEFKAGYPGLRDYMLCEALLLRKYLDAAAGGESNYIFCGDPNTMGLDYPYTAHDIAPQDELAELSRRAAHYTKHMRFLSKNRPYTWLPNCASTLQPQDLDHVVAGVHLLDLAIHLSEHTVNQLAHITQRMIFHYVFFPA